MANAECGMRGGGDVSEAIHTLYTTRHAATPIAIHAVAWEGPGGRLPVVMLHGIWDTWRIFERLAAHLSAEQTIYALDLRGHGDSDKPAEGYAITDYAADVRDVID